MRPLLDNSTLDQIYVGIPTEQPTGMLKEGYRSALVLTNFSSHRTKILVTTASTPGSGTAKLTPQVIQLQAHDTQEVSIKNSDPSTDFRTSVTVSSKSKSSDIATALVSTNPHGRVVAAPLKSPHDAENAGAHPWKVGDGVNSTLLLFNDAPIPSPFTVSLASATQPWQKTIMVPAFATYHFDIGAAIATRQLDDTGLALALKTEHGEISWVGSSHGKGRVLQYVRESGVLRSYSCGIMIVPCAPSGGTFEPNSLVATPGTTVNVGVLIPFCQTTFSCSGVTSYGTNSDPGIQHWSASTASVASIQSTNNFSAAVLGNSAGSSNLSFTWNRAAGAPYPQYTCSGSASTNITVTSPADHTPILNGISPSVWTSGQVTPNVTFSGDYFGTNTPTLTFTPSSGISYSLIPGGHNDTTITANITVAPGVPNEDVSVAITNTGYSGNSFQSGGGTVSPTSGPTYATVHSPMNTPEITVVGWVDSNFPLPSGENPVLQNALNTTAGCVLQVTNLELSKLGLVVAGTADVAYTNAWLVQNSANYNSATNPIPSTITPSVLYSAGNFRLFNDFGHGGGTYKLGVTPDPCKTGLIPSSLEAAQPSIYLGYTNTTPTASGETYQIAEGRVGALGQVGSFTLNERTVPWIWSVIDFNAAGAPMYSNVAQFPTYSVYQNGILVHTYPQSSVASFTALTGTYQITPAQIP